MPQLNSILPLKNFKTLQYKTFFSLFCAPLYWTNWHAVNAIHLVYRERIRALGQAEAAVHGFMPIAQLYGASIFP